MRPGVSLGVLGCPGDPGVSWGNQTDPIQGSQWGILINLVKCEVKP